MISWQGWGILSFLCSWQEAQAQAEHYLTQVRVAQTRAFDRHKLFWIPMQHITWLIAAFGVLMSVVFLTGQS